MAKHSVAERLAAVETELPHIWREVKSTAASLQSASETVSKVQKDLEKIRSALYAAVTLMAAVILQSSGEPVVKFIATALRTAALSSLK